MKRIPEILIFLLITTGVLTSGTTERKHTSILQWNSFKDLQYDTSGFIHLIEVDSFNLTIFPPSSGVQFYKDGIVFLFPSKNEVKILPEHISFGTFEAYIAKIEDSSLGKPIIFSPSYSFSYPSEAMTFSTDFNTVYFTKIPKKDDKEKIYLAKYNSNGRTKSGWLSEEIPQDFCSENSTYSHPALSTDESELIFASDKENSIGGMDLFITRKEGDKWSAPKNLGNLINTTGNEFFPFLDFENNLFFSSDGLDGYGGFDIFTCKFNGQTWDEPKNLSNSINSESDDIAFTINKMDGQTAFYTKRQISNPEEMQLFRVTLKKGIPENSQLNISYIFNGKPSLKPFLTSETIESEVKPVEATSQVAINKPESAPAKLVQSAGNKNKEIPMSGVNKDSVKAVIPYAETKKTETVKTPVLAQTEKKDIVLYRVQIQSSNKAKGVQNITINNKNYSTFEYFYVGEYRTCVGNFSTLAPAAELQRTCRKSGYPQAFVVAFKNNSRSLDHKLFK